MSVFIVLSVRGPCDGPGGLNECVCCQLEVSATVLGSPNGCVCCLLSVRVFCDGPGQS